MQTYHVNTYDNSMCGGAFQHMLFEMMLSLKFNIILSKSILE